MFVKRPMYNHQLQCVAFEILPHQNCPINETMITSLIELISLSDQQLPVLIPFAFKQYIEESQQQFNNPIILKLNAKEIDTVYPANEIKDCMFSIALLIDNPQQLAWLNFADYIGLTEKLLNGSDMTKVVNYSKSKQRKVIAYDIDNPVIFDKCKAMTMDFYCGDFIFNPSEDDHTEIAGNKLNVLTLIDTLQKDDCDFSEVSDIIQTDPLLSYQLLRVANSAGFSGGTPIDSIEQAVTRLGLQNLKKWVMFLSMKNISNKPMEILESGLIRAYMAEQIAKANKEVSSQSAYTAGLLSILDCLLDKPMAVLVEQITIADEIKIALKDKEGSLGKLLALVIAYEKGDWLQVEEYDYQGPDLSRLYIESLGLAASGTRATRD